MDESSPAPAIHPIERLAARELECIRAVAQHKRSAQIAHELSLKPKTVDTYIATACRKLGVGDRDSAARMLIEYERISGKSLSDSSGVEADTPNRPTSWLSRLPWPIPTDRRPINDLTPLQLMISVGGAAAFMMIAASLYFAAIALLSSFFGFNPPNS